MNTIVTRKNMMEATKYSMAFSKMRMALSIGRSFRNGEIRERESKTRFGNG